MSWLPILDVESYLETLDEVNEVIENLQEEIADEEYWEHCIECCSEYCGGDEPMGNELCLCDCDTICSDVLDYDYLDEEEESYGEEDY